MDTADIHKTHYGLWKRWVRVIPGYQELYVKSLIGMKTFSYLDVDSSPFVRSMYSVSNRVDDRSMSLLIREIFSVMAFDYYGKAVLEVNSDLAEMLLETELNVPIREICFPRYSFYVPIPDNINFMVNIKNNLQRVLGVYVTYQTKVKFPDGERFDGDDSFILFFCVVKDGLVDGYEDFSYYFWSFHFFQDSEELMEERMKKIMVKWREKFSFIHEKINEQITRLILNSFLYMNQPSSEQDVKFTPHKRMEMIRNNPRISNIEKEKIMSNYWLSANFELFETGKTIIITKNKPTPTTGIGEAHSSPITHWRRGHWHRYRIGQGRLQTIVRWIKPLRVMGRTEIPEPTKYKLV